MFTYPFSFLSSTGVGFNMFNFGTSKSVEVADHATLDMTNDFSGCAFVYPNNRLASNNVIGKYHNAGNQTSYLLAVGTTGVMKFWHSVDGAAETIFTSTIDVPVDTLSLLHFRLTGGTLYLGINGVLEQSIARGACFASISNVEIGSAGQGSFYNNDFDITQPMLFDSGSSLANFLTLYNSGIPVPYDLIPTSITDDCVMALEMSSNDDSLTDLSVNTNDGTAVGGVIADGEQVLWGGIPTDITQAFLFQAGADEVNFSQDTSLDLSDYTLIVWFNRTANPSSHEVLAGRASDGAEAGQVIRIDTAGKIQCYHIQQGSSEGGSIFNNVSSTTDVCDGDLHCVALKFEVGVGSELVIDGVSVDTDTTTTAAISTFTQDFIAGAQSGGSPRRYSGSLAAVQLINYSMSNSDIDTKIYNSGELINFSLQDSTIKTGTKLYAELTARDDTGNDLSGTGNDGTISGGIPSTGDNITFISA